MSSTPPVQELVGVGGLAHDDSETRTMAPEASELFALAPDLSPSTSHVDPQPSVSDPMVLRPSLGFSASFDSLLVLPCPCVLYILITDLSIHFPPFHVSIFLQSSPFLSLFEPLRPSRSF